MNDEKPDQGLANLVSALAQARAEFPPIPRTKTVATRSYTFKYAPLEVIMDAIKGSLSKHGICLAQTIKDGCVVTLVGKDDCLLELAPVPISFKDLSPQQVGALLTYTQRYSLRLALLLPTEDDDEAQLLTMTDKQTENGVDYSVQEQALRSCTSMADLQETWKVLSAAERRALSAIKDQVKAELEMGGGNG